MWVKLYQATYNNTVNSTPRTHRRGNLSLYAGKLGNLLTWTMGSTADKGPLVHSPGKSVAQRSCVA
jgi:hypothetical protein